MHLGIYTHKKKKKRKKKEKGDTFKYTFLPTESNTKGISKARTFKKQRKATFADSMVSLQYLFLFASYKH